MSRLEQIYQKEVVPRLRKDMSFKNDLAIPKISKIVVAAGVGWAQDDPKLLKDVVSDLTKITGQKPIITRAKAAISGFKLKAGAQVGVKVTLRRTRMWDFLDRLINLALPRARDFRGVKAKFDHQGNLSIGLAEQIIFPEIKISEVEKPFSLEITIVTRTDKDKEAKKLLEGLGMIFEKK